MRTMMGKLWIGVLVFLGLFGTPDGQALRPPSFNLALFKKVHTTATCGELNGKPHREMFCDLTATTFYQPRERYQVIEAENLIGADPREGPSSELRSSAAIDSRDHKYYFLQDGQNCEYCDSSVAELYHPAENLVDGTFNYWQSPPLSRGMEYFEVNITIDLEQEFHVAYLLMKMANSPRPAVWVLERSRDYGKTYTPWQYFAENYAQCQDLFGEESLQPIVADDTVVCSTEYSQTVPLEDGEVTLSLVNDRPGSSDFWYSPTLQNWTRATNVRLRLLRAKTLQGLHLAEISRTDPTTTRRFFYSIREIQLGGRCVCHGHAETCDILDVVNRPNTWLCRCEHNTCGDTCERCCDGFVQKQWQPVDVGLEFECEPCNCFGHTTECVYDPEVDRDRLSLDIHGEYIGGGVCQNCQHNTQGINCQQCIFGYYRPQDRALNATDVCEECDCPGEFFSGDCMDGTAKCLCKHNYLPPECDDCAPGYHNYPECRPCDCHINGTIANVCVPRETKVDGKLEMKCPCKDNYDGALCRKCAPGYFNFPTCEPCQCFTDGAVNNICDLESGHCQCRPGFAGANCTECKHGHYDYPRCQDCRCDPTGAEPEVCNKETGKCLCKPGFSTLTGCGSCEDGFHGYPNCKRCECDTQGSQNQVCDKSNGQCSCHGNFVGRNCSQCSPGYYDFPSCLPCKCGKPGSEGLTCNKGGQCFCKPNFDGLKCDRCKQNFYNFPVCEECNCEPAGVPVTFKGCDQVAPGELCECKERVTGRICNQCKPTFWNLQFSNKEGCQACGCNLTGTVSRLDTCDMVSGQCHCKLHANGRRCAQCKAGFYGLQDANALGCQPCNCDVGGSVHTACESTTGRCFCRNKVGQRDCSQPMDGNFYPTLWHLQYEIEDGYGKDGEPARFAIDEQQFPRFSWRGYVVYNPIQEEVYMDISAPQKTIYRMLANYISHVEGTVPLEVRFQPLSPDADALGEQTMVANLPEAPEPKAILLEQRNGKPVTFLLEGRWRMHVTAKKRLFLDYLVLLPQTYFQPTLLKDRIDEACEALNVGNTTCREYKYPPLAYPAATISNMVTEPNREAAKEYPEDKLPVKFGPAASVKGQQPLLITVEAARKAPHVIVIEYYNLENGVFPFTTELLDHGPNATGRFTPQRCPFTSLCRQVIVTDDGQPAHYDLEPGKSTIRLTPDVPVDMAVAHAYAVPFDEWSPSYLTLVPYCLSRNGKCHAGEFPLAGTQTQVEFEEAPNENITITASQLPFKVADPAAKFVQLDKDRRNVSLIGTVPKKDQYVVILHYHQPNKAEVKLNVSLLDEKDYQEKTGKYLEPATIQAGVVGNLTPNAYVRAPYCPSVAGCRAVIKLNVDNNMQVPLTGKFVATFSSHGPDDDSIYLDYVLAVPMDAFRPDILREQTSVDQSRDFVAQCSADDTMHVDPTTASEQCKKGVFSLTTEFNNGALACDCNVQGSTSLMCEKFGGKCPCKNNIIGRQCSMCKPGHYGFPDCRPCSCMAGQQCDPKTGQCICPPFTTGISCDRCDSKAFGYDPLIGCQDCGCNRDGTVGSLQCDQLTGQCECKEHIGGRRCDRCSPGYYGFPFCHACACERAGTTDEICDQATATCLCKENVHGLTCADCKDGTYYLEERNPKGCTDCFCFATTSQCDASYQHRRSEITSTTGWTASNLPQSNVVADGPHNLTLTTDSKAIDPQKGIYLLAPQVFLGKHLFSYGGAFSYQLHVVPVSADTPVESQINPDVVLKGHNMTLEFYSEQQPSDLSQPFRVTIDLLPEKLVLPDGSRVTRSQLMTVLNDIVALQVKVSVYRDISKATLSNIKLDSAFWMEPQAPEELLVQSIEVCRCPAPYNGSSCENCAQGHYRVQQGPVLGACVPCQCHGHTTRCDPVTGKCLDCQHNTVGDHCEKCAVSFYGDPKRGTPDDCQRCACPQSTLENNFALSCTVLDGGIVAKCNCKEGYTGDRCEQCSTGYHGNPNQPGGSCVPCDCSTNNDLTQPDSCDHRTGRCYNCKGHTRGEHCEICDEWFYGDAVEAKNCSACVCNKCGSGHCDYRGGRCQCKNNVEGPSCDKCVANAWGFDSCTGCLQCNCAQAAATLQCDGASGQCVCNPGATGLQCERCQNGFWSYSPSGCRKCDCEADLSMGTVCDIYTGQCQCMEGATGSRCDQCLEGFLRVPERGCLFCDECVHVLNNDMIALNVRIEATQGELQNVSTAYLRDKRLQSISTSASDLMTDLSNLVVDQTALDTIHVVSELDRVDKRTRDLWAKSNRTQNEAHESYAESQKLMHDGHALESDVAKLDKKIKAEVQRARDLANTLGHGEFSSQKRDALVAQAEEMIAKLRAVTFDALNSTVQDAYSSAQEALDNVTKFVNDLHSVQQQLHATEDKMKAFTHNVEELRVHVINASNAISVANVVRENVKANPALVADQHIGDKIEKINKNLEGARKDIAAVQPLIDDQTRVNDEIENTATYLNESFDGVRNKSQTLQGQMTDAERLAASAKGKATELNQQAEELSNQFSPARQGAASALEASSVYSNITSSLVDAEAAANNASEASEGALGTINGLEQQAIESRKTSAELNLAATKVKGSVVNDVDKILHREKEQLNATANSMAEHRTHLDRLAGKLDNIDQAALLEKMDRVQHSSEETQTEADKISQRLETILSEAANLKGTAGNHSSQSFDSSRAVKNSEEQLSRVSALIPKVLEDLESARASEKNSSASMEDLDEKLTELRRLVMYARDTANRIKLGARTYGNATLQLQTPPRVTRAAAYTLLSLSFKTDQSNGLLLFLGNEVGATKTRLVPQDDYLGLELDSGRVKLVYDFGSGPAVIWGVSNVADNKWHKVTVDRTGKSAKLIVDTDGKDPVVSEGVSPGERFVFNLHQDVSRLYIGGVPDSFKMPATLGTDKFNGVIENIDFQGSQAGLWNFALDGRADTYGYQDIPDKPTGRGYTFDGQGYVVLKRGTWSAKKRAVISVSFKTYARKALLFYIGREPDFMAIELSDGHVVFKYDLGSGMGMATSNKKYNDGTVYTVVVERNEKDVNLTVNRDDHVTATSPGTMFELGLSDEYFVGGFNDTRSRRHVTSTPFLGCVVQLTLDGTPVDFGDDSVIKMMGVKPDCPPAVVRTVSFDAPDGGQFVFDGITLGTKIGMTFKFKTTHEDGLLFVLTNKDRSNIVAARLNGANLMVVTKVDAAGAPTVAKTPDSNLANGDWHYVSVVRGGAGLSFLLDDQLSIETSFGVLPEFPDGEAHLYFGAMPDDLTSSEPNLLGDRTIQPFVGCIGDVVYAGTVLQFANATKSGNVDLTGCSMDEVVPTAPPPQDGPVEDGFTPPTDQTTESPRVVTYEPIETTRADLCVLPLRPQGERDDSKGHRFGLTQDSNLQFDSLPSPFDIRGNFSMRFRAVAWDGVLLFATNTKRTDYLSIYMKGGHVHFTFNGGSNATVNLVTQLAYKDTEWHHVQARRDGAHAELFVDNVLQANTTGALGEAADGIDTERPIYVGGIPRDVLRAGSTNKIIGGVSNVFGGCIRALQLNGQSFGPASRKVDVGDCMRFTEQGMYFGRSGGYAILHEHFNVGQHMSLEFEVKPRVDNGVLLWVSAANGDFLGLLLVEGTLKFQVNNGAGVEEAKLSLNSSRVCDGHWHKIKIYKTKNMMSLAWDTQHTMTIMKHTQTFDTTTNDPFYLGGVPKSPGVPADMETSEFFVGCVRFPKSNRRHRKATNFDIATAQVFGEVIKDSCPVN